MEFQGTLPEVDWPLFPGSDPACRERTALEQASHESNIKVVVLGDDPTPRQFATELLKGEVPWTVTTFDYVAVGPDWCA